MSEPKGIADPEERGATGREADNPSAIEPGAYHWRRQTMAETFARIVADPAHPWLAIGEFLDDWRFTAMPDRLDLVREGIGPAAGDPDLRR
jgi:hypothetical protein